jgi:hypothetical protein
MLAQLLQLLMGVIADLLLDTVRSGHRSYEAEIDRYLEATGPSARRRRNRPRRKASLPLRWAAGVNRG